MVRMIDIAKKTGFSINTVSHVINGIDVVKPETKKIIEDCIKEMGYVKNNAASKLRSGKSNMIALVLDNFLNPHCAVIADEVTLYATALGYSVSIFSTNGDSKKEKKAVQNIIESGADGVVMMPVTNTEENIAMLKNASIPCVFIERLRHEFDNVPHVVYEEMRAGYLIGEHLYENGHRKVMIVLCEPFVFESEQRLEGMRSAYWTYGSSLDESGIRRLSLNIRSHENELDVIMREIDEYTAVVCYDDFIALKIATRLKMAGKRVPEDISIIGFGNLWDKFPVNMPITTVKSSKKQLTVSALDLLNELIKNENGKSCVLPVELVDGGTVKKIN